MDGDVKKIKQITVGPKFIIPAEGFVSNNLTRAELIPLSAKSNGSFIKNFIPDAIDAAELIPVELGGRLVQAPISINELGKQLLKAAAEGNVDEIKLLMNKGAPFTADWLGTSPLHFAAQNNHLEVCEILLKAGISKDARTKVDRTPLHMAAYEGHLDIVKCLLKNKADIDCKDLLSMTPLHWAVQNCHVEVVEWLLRHGAQKNVVNKFNLTPMDIAEQCDRSDIIELINTIIPDSVIAAHNLAMEMSEMDNSSDTLIYPPVETLHTEPNSPIPLETVLEDIDSENSIDPERLHISQDEAVVNSYNLKVIKQNEVTEEISDNQNSKFSESIKLLQQHGITMLPADDTNILSSILETGHSVVLTEVGKQVLNSTKPTESLPVHISKPKQIKTMPVSIKPKKIITMSSEEFLAMTLNQGNVLKQINGKFSLSKPTVKRIVMKKNKVFPITKNINAASLQKSEGMSDMETLMKQLIEARKLVEEYKQKFLQKKAEAEQYKQQLLLLAQSHNKIFME